MKTNTIKLFIVFVYVLFSTLTAWLTNGRSLIGIDDANIYLVYMRNFAHGHGFVYNIGSEKVEGFTSLLWTLIGSFFYSVKQNPEILLLITNTVLISYALWKVVCYIDRDQKDSCVISPSSLLFLGLIFAIPGYFTWTVLSLMETGLWSALLIALTLHVIDGKSEQYSVKSTLKFSLLIVLLVLCRPESISWGLFFIVSMYIKMMMINNSIKKSFYLITPLLFVFICSIAFLILWRKIYFGFPFPNTYYAKIDSDITNNFKFGIRYIYLSFINNPIILLIISISLISLYKFWKDRTLKTQYSYYLCFGITLLTLIIPLYTGGDHFGYSRFIQPTTPIILLCLIFFIQYFKINLSYLNAISFLILSTFISKSTIYDIFLKHRSPVIQEWEIAVKGRENSNMLNLFFNQSPVYPSQGVLMAGGSAYAYKGKTIDLLGLNNVEMAHKEKNKNKKSFKNHASFNKDVFFKQKPDLFWNSSRFIHNNNIPEKKHITIDLFFQIIYQNVELDNRFNELYSSVLISNKYVDFSLLIFASKSFLEKIDTSIYTYKLIPYE